MIDNEIINDLKLLKSEIEWDYPLEHQIALDRAIKALERDNADGCQDCKYEDKDEFEMPCLQCKRNKKDFYKLVQGGSRIGARE